MTLLAAYLNAGVVLERYVYKLLPPPPSLISLMVSVDVKHHVYLLTKLVVVFVDDKHHVYYYITRRPTCKL